MTTYLTNVSIIPSNFNGMIDVSTASIDTVKAILKNGFISAIGHQGTADLLSVKLAQPIIFNRLNIEAKPNDTFICFQTVTRMAEGKVYTKEEMQTIPCIWKILFFK